MRSNYVIVEQKICICVVEEIGMCKWGEVLLNSPGAEIVLQCNWHEDDVAISLGFYGQMRMWLVVRRCGALPVPGDKI